MPNPNSAAILGVERKLFFQARFSRAVGVAGGMVAAVAGAMLGNRRAPKPGGLRRT